MESEQFHIKFEYMKDTESMLADTVSRLVNMDPKLCFQRELVPSADLDTKEINTTPTEPVVNLA